MDLLLIAIILAILATVAALILGLMTMSGGDPTRSELGTPLMWLRVGLQTLTLVLLAVAVLVRQHS